MNFSRRALLAALASSPLVAHGAGIAQKKGVLVGGLKGANPTTGALEFALTLLDLDAPAQRRYVGLSFLAHGFALDPRNPHRALVFEKRGPGAAEVDLREAKFVRALQTSAGRAFYGHGTFSKSGDVLFVAETELETRQGLLSVWDGRTLAPLGQFPTYGEKPHDVLLSPDGRRLVVTNGGGAFPDGDAPCVTVIDVKSRKLLEKHVFTDPRINAGHVKLSARGDLVVASAPRDGLPKTEHGALSLKAPGGALTTLSNPLEVTRAMTGETLSLAIHEPTRRVMATNPDGNLVTVWNLVDQTFVKSFSLPLARGVMLTLDGAHFVVCHAATATVSFISTKTLELVPELDIEKSFVAGSHLFAWNGALR